MRFLLLLLLACGPTGTGPTERCETIGQQCRLRDGLLGVCSPTEPCDEPPCLACTPQH